MDFEHFWCQASIDLFKGPHLSRIKPTSAEKWLFEDVAFCGPLVAKIYVYRGFFSHILDQRQIPFVLVCITPKVNIFHETLSYVADKIFKLSTNQVFCFFAAGTGVHCFGPRRPREVCQVLTSILTYIKTICATRRRYSSLADICDKYNLRHLSQIWFLPPVANIICATRRK